MTLHFLNDVAYDAESTQTSKLRHNRFEECSTMGKLINRIPEVSSIMRVLAERSLTGTYLYSLCVKPDISTTSASKRSHY